MQNKYGHVQPTVMDLIDSPRHMQSFRKVVDLQASSVNNLCHLEAVVEQYVTEQIEIWVFRPTCLKLKTNGLLMENGSKPPSEL